MKKIYILFLILIFAFSLLYSADDKEKLSVSLNLSGGSQGEENIEIGFSSNEIKNISDEVKKIDGDFSLMLLENEYYARNAVPIFAYYKIMSGKNYSMKIYLDDVLKSGENEINWYVSENDVSLGLDASYGESQSAVDTVVHDSSKDYTSSGSIKLNIWTDYLIDAVPGIYKANLKLGVYSNS